ncbi:type II secretion system protein N (GspN) [Halopseudomonas xinjiangensis]|uniref:Type II secretion system protein N n=1 Tax=Halopseudomonas xinjiangensis TaxID=487184 RepID=A0A1H1UAU2_9GAMM|nr:type II secretion system protein N [Halopseudomonas xinjiangensis]SDS69604.1 type II secretion system protein N (GspN) [Halopseudomonas xinjiangensis]
MAVNVRKRTVISVAALLFLGSLIWNIPAAFVWSLVESRLPAKVTVTGLTGTLWSGQVRNMQVGGIEQGALIWSWNPGQAFLGRLGLDVAWLPRNGRVDAQLKMGASSLRIENANGRLDAATMAALNKAPFILGGTWLFDVPLLELEDFERVQAAEGRLVWQDAAGGLPQPLPLGHLAADLGAEDGWLVLDLSDEGGGPLGLRGSARWRPAEPMHIDARLRAEASAEPTLTQGLGLLGRPDQEGWVQWRARLQ